MHVANLNPAEVREAAYRRFDVSIRQGTAGGRPAQESDRQRTEVGLSPMAYIAGSAAEMMRLPAPRPDLRGFGGDYPHFADPRPGQVETRGCSSRPWASPSTAKPRPKAWGGNCRRPGSCRTSGIRQWGPPHFVRPPSPRFAPTDKETRISLSV